uniref:Uncharacterized protein n=1 Tax=Kalanchoe fedtschenkoi TaxID=63787 RepID=A0A7N0V559_KALFE
MLIKTPSSFELRDCSHHVQPLLIAPSRPTPNHTLYLSNLDDQPFLRFSIKYLYLFKKSVSVDTLKRSLALVLADYYPLAGRLRVCPSNDHKLEVDCNGEGAVFVEAFMDSTAEELSEILNKKPNKSWRKLLHRVDGATSFIDIPPLIVQVTYLRCGGMILSTAISHCLCDGIGTSQFLHAWAYLTANQDADELLQIHQPFHCRHVLGPRVPPRVEFDHLAYYQSTHESDCGYDLYRWLQSQPLVPSSVIFTAADILRLKRRCLPTIKCTAFEALASHTWRSWVESLALPMNLNVKLLFSINVREKMSHDIPEGYYGNAFVLGCAETTAKQLVNSNLHDGVTLVQAAKKACSRECVKSLVDLLEDDKVKTDLRGSFVISQWSKLGLEEADFGGGKCMHMGAVASDVCCLFLPVVGHKDSIRVLVSMPEAVVEKFEDCMKGFLDEKEDCNAGKDGWIDNCF